MSYCYDRFEDNPIHAAEQEEARDAMRYTTYSTCGRHDYKPDRHGGGICIDCGDEIGADEL